LRIVSIARSLLATGAMPADISAMPADLLSDAASIAGAAIAPSSIPVRKRRQLFECGGSAVPTMLPEGLPARATHARFDFTDWADGQAWKFLKGEDYTSTTESFRYNVRRWAKAEGVGVETRPIPAVDDRGRPVPATKMEPIGLAVRFTPRNERSRAA
jgi:hypothetical protein